MGVNAFGGTSIDHPDGHAVAERAYEAGVVVPQPSARRFVVVTTFSLAARDFPEAQETAAVLAAELATDARVQEVLQTVTETTE